MTSSMSSPFTQGSPIIEGNLATMTLVAYSESDQLAEFDQLSVAVQDPAGTIATYVLGTASNLTLSTPYEAQLVLDTTGQVGVWSVVAQATGSLQAVAQLQFTTLAQLIA